ncbi:MAG TPA: SDR family oxidoreductase [Solirubrobacteraceae bacterium]|nr:SDR family oxidoreductase [Solirubrobacteraceae bacterium]
MSLPAPAPDTTILITGASSGIGRELARRLSGRGHDLTLTARRAERLDALAEDLRLAHGTHVEVRAADVADPGARGELIEELRAGGRDVIGVCNNAGFGTYGRFQELDLGREQLEVHTNVEAVHHLTGAFLPEMVQRGAGAILNVASSAAFQPLPFNATYAATKAFVLSFSEAVHTDLGGTGVSCSALCPGPVRTEFADVAGMGGLDDNAPDLLWQSAEECARDGVEAMIKGKRTVVPLLANKLTASAGRITPRSLLLPVVKLVYGRLG